MNNLLFDYEDQFLAQDNLPIQPEHRVLLSATLAKRRTGPGCARRALRPLTFGLRGASGGRVGYGSGVSVGVSVTGKSSVVNVTRLVRPVMTSAEPRCVSVPSEARTV